MILFPNAKINLGLNIVARRPDGYHDLETVMFPVAWRDVLEIVPAAGPQSTLTTLGRPVDCPPEKNLVMKALRALEAEVGPVAPVDIYLEKIIPDGAGLGGGSADAAFALRGFNEVLRVGLSDDRLAAIASKVGADCPFFIYNSPAYRTGTGTDIELIDLHALDRYTIAISKPKTASVSTAKAYAGVTPRPATERSLDVVAEDPRKWSGRLVNDFEKSIFPICPEVKRVKETFEKAGALYASMSGSGAAVYAIFDDDNMARRALASMADCDTFCHEASFC